MVKKFRRYVYSFWRDPRTWWTDRRTDGQTLHDSKDRAYVSHRAVKWRNDAAQAICCLLYLTYLAMVYFASFSLSCLFFYCCCLWWRIKLCVSSRKQSGLTCGLTCIRPVHCHYISNLFLVNNQSNKADKARLQFVRHSTSTAVSCYAP